MRYLRLYLYFLRFSFSKAMEFRFDFFFKFFMDCVYYAVNWVFYWAIFQHTESIGGWRMDQAMVFVATTFVVDALMMTIYMPNLWNLPSLINKGDLDYYLVRPVNSMFFVTLRDFAANSFLNLLVAIGVLWFALANLIQPLSAPETLVFLMLVLNGAYLVYLIYMLHLIPVFWTQAPHGYHELFWTLNQFSEKPHRVFSRPIQRVLMTIAPFALMSSVPVEMLVNGFSWELLSLTVVVTVAFACLVGWLWGQGLKRYSSASS